MISETVVRELQITHGWTRDFVEKLAPYYVATLRNMNEGRTTPVYQVIDEIWHAHILCTRDYAEFCTRTFGRFIDHERTESPPQIERDFFPAHGLSVDGLASICAEHIPSQELIFAACGQDNPPAIGALAACGAGDVPPAVALATCGGSPTPATPTIDAMAAQVELAGETAPSLAEVDRGGGRGALRIATCTPPAPPTIPTPNASPRIARCGEPDTPTPPDYSARL